MSTESATQHDGGDTPADDYRSHQASRYTSLLTDFLRDLLAQADRLPSPAHPRPYWRQRQQGASAGAPAELHAGWARIIVDLRVHGYFDRIAGRPCVSERDEVLDPDIVLTNELGKRLGATVNPEWLNHWSAADWEDDEFYDLVEVMHDLVARPRTRTACGLAPCPGHYSKFSIPAGQALYRWRVNDLLASHGIGLELADQGEDLGRLGSVPTDGRNELLQQAADTSTTPATRRTVEHAIALFRSRTATREDKRSACIALAAVLEERREQLQADLLSKDEGALFQIANQFAIRHRRADQHPDYDQAYLDWLFWWYLATVELTNRLLIRDPVTPA